MINTENQERKNARSEGEIKADFRRFFKKWHPQSGVKEATSERSEDVPILNLLSQLLTAFRSMPKKNLSGWPDAIRTGTRVVFPNISNDMPGRAFFLPRTPEEFFDLLDYIDRRQQYPTKDFPLVGLAHVEAAEDEDDDVDGGEDFAPKEDPALEKFRTYVSNRESISDLLYALEIVDLFNEEQLRAIQFSKLFDERAYFLFVRASWNAKTTEEVKPLLDEIETKKEFKFYSEEVRAKTLAAIRIRIQEIESTSREPADTVQVGHVPVSIEAERKQLGKIVDPVARRHFVEQVREASTVEQIEALENQIDKFPFLNRGELGVVRSVLSRKKQKISQMRAIDDRVSS